MSRNSIIPFIILIRGSVLFAVQSDTIPVVPFSAEAEHSGHYPVPAEPVQHRFWIDGGVMNSDILSLRFYVGASYSRNTLLFKAKYSSLPDQKWELFVEPSQDAHEFSFLVGKKFAGKHVQGELTGTGGAGVFAKIKRDELMYKTGNEFLSSDHYSTETIFLPSIVAEAGFMITPFRFVGIGGVTSVNLNTQYPQANIGVKIAVGNLR